MTRQSSTLLSFMGLEAVLGESRGVETARLRLLRGAEEESQWH